jgi:hypothetical protein
LGKAGLISRKRSLIYLTHLFAAAFRRGLGRGRVFEGVALITDVAFLLLLGSRRSFLGFFGLTTTTTHEFPPFSGMDIIMFINKLGRKEGKSSGAVIFLGPNQDSLKA